MKILNNKGFALVETLIVATFVMGILTLILTNFLPMIGTYEKRERYDDIDSVYNTYLIKKMLENSETKNLNSSLKNGIDGRNSKVNPINCSIYNNTDFLDYCQNLFQNMGVSSAIVTSYNIQGLKSDFPSNASKDLRDYVSSLPNFVKNPNNYTYRIIIKYKHVVNRELDLDTAREEDIYYSYSTMGVDL